MLTPPVAILARGSSETEATIHAVAPGATTVALPGDLALADAKFARVGDDLVVSSADGHQAIVSHYFAASPPPSLHGGDGIMLDGSVIGRLAPLAPAQVAQNGAPGVGEPIGSVDNVSGTVSVIRADGSHVTLHVGDPVFQGDVVESGADGGLGIVFADETSFSMGPSGRMVLDEMIYDPSAGTGSFSVSLVHGLFSMVSGQIAKLDPDAMVVNTPVATIGIRGTQIGFDFQDGEHLTVVAMRELGGFVGEIVVRNGGGVTVLNQANEVTSVWGVNVPPTDVLTISDADLLSIFTRALMHLPTAQGTENNYGAHNDDTTFLSDFSTAAGGDESIVGGAGSDVIHVTNQTPTDFQPVPQINGNGPGTLDLGGGPGGFGGGPNDSNDPTPPFTPLPGSPLDGFNQIIGTPDNDVLTGGPGRDYIFGGAGNDILTGAGDNDIVYGGDGDDIIVGGHGNGNDLYVGGNPPAELGGDGLDNDGPIGDTVTYHSASEGVIVNLSDSAVAIKFDDGTPDGVFIPVSAGTARDALLQDFQNPDAEHINVDILAQIENVEGGSGRDILIGSDVANRLFGGDGNDLLIGNGGNDILVGGAGDDELIGGTGDDDLYGSAMDGAVGFASNGDEAGAHNTVNYSATTQDVTVSLATGLATGAEIGTDHLFDITGVVGGAGNDTLTGDNDANELTGGTGNDQLNGGGGDDQLTGGAGDDQLTGGGGVDTANFSGNRNDYSVVRLGDGLYQVTDIFGGDIDRVSGVEFLHFADITVATASFDDPNPGDPDPGDPEPGEPIPGQLIVGGNRSDTLVGGAGDDTIIGSGGTDNMNGGAGSDTFQIIVGDHNGFDQFFGGSGIDRILGTTGADVIGIYGAFNPDNSVEFIDGAGGNDVIRGTGDRDIMDFTDTKLIGITQIEGGAGSDIITGSRGNDVIVGGSGPDIMDGGAGDDTFLVQGSGGFDRFTGGEGHDTILGSAGADVIGIYGLFGPSDSIEVINGGGGDDVIRGTDNQDIMDFSGFTDKTLIGIAEIQGGAGADIITGSSGNDVIVGGAGNDTLNGGAGNDTFQIQGSSDDFDRFFGGAGNDTILGSTGDDVIGIYSAFNHLGNSVETIDGGGGDDVIRGTQSQDTMDFSGTALIGIARIEGGAGADVITGSDGNDVIAGGAGNDRMTGGIGNDTFQFGATDQGKDTVADFGGAGGTDDDRLLLTGDFQAGDVSFIFSAGADKVQWTNADGHTQTVELTGNHNISADSYQVTETANGVEVTLANSVA